MLDHLETEWTTTHRPPRTAHLLGLDVETVGSRLDGISAGLPSIVAPHVTLSEAAALVGPAFTIALLGAIESLLSATVADGMISSRHRPNVELVAQGSRTWRRRCSAASPPPARSPAPRRTSRTVGGRQSRE